MKAKDDDRIDLSKHEISQMLADPTWAAQYPPVLTIDQAASLLKVPKATLYDWRSRGLLNGCCKKVGKHLRFLRDRFLRKIFSEGLGDEK